MLEEAYVLWLAGFYEGEGSCGFYPNQGSGVLRVSIWQNERGVLDEIKIKFGFGCVSKSKSCYAYHCSHHGAEILLRTISPYLRSEYKRNQAITALSGWGIREKYHMNEKTKTRLSAIRSDLANHRTRINGRFA